MSSGMWYSVFKKLIKISEEGTAYIFRVGDMGSKKQAHSADENTLFRNSAEHLPSHTASHSSQSVVKSYHIQNT
jgi:hypothetical protein